MKQAKAFLRVLILAVAILMANRTSAFPLYLSRTSGTITATDQFGSDANTTSSKAENAPVNLNNILSLVSNTVAINSGTNVPANVKIAYDPYTFRTYLTNTTGYAYDLTNVVSIRIDDVATSFRSNGGVSATENDFALIELDVKGTAADGLSYEFDIYGMGTITGALNSNTGNARLMISLSNGAGYGQLRSSADGISKGGFSLSGSGTLPQSAQNQPYSVYWWNNQ